jgi:hypothetical protein
MSFVKEQCLIPLLKEGGIGFFLSRPILLSTKQQPGGKATVLVEQSHPD